MIAYVTHIGGTKQGVADSMYQHVGIAVAQQSEMVLKLNAAHPQFTTFHQLVNVVSHSNTYIHRLNRSLMPSISKASVKRRVWSRGLERAVEMT